MDDLKAENERAWLAYRNSPAFRASFAGQMLEVKERLQTLKQAMKPVPLALLNWIASLSHLLNWMRIH